MSTLFAPEFQIYVVIAALAFIGVSFFKPGVGLVLMTFAMLFSPEFEIGSLASRSVVLRIEDILIPLLVLAWIARLAIRREFRLFAASPLNIPILAVLLLSIFSTGRGIAAGSVPSPLTSFFFIGKTMEFFAIFFLVMNYVRTEEGVRRFLTYVICVVALLGVYTLYQVPHIEIFTERRITAPFEGNPEPATIGGYMAFLLLIILSIFLYEENGARKFLFACLGVIVFIPFLYTLNRTSYVALLGGLFFLALVEKRKWFTLLMMAFLLVSPLLLPKVVKDRIAWTWQDAVNPGRDLGVDASLQGRIYAFRKLWGLWRDSPIIGAGVCSWGIPDSQYARTLQEIGIIGLGLWIWIFTRLYRISRWLFENCQEGMLKGFLLGYRAGLFVIAIHGFGAVTLYIVRIMEPFWFISGLVVSFYLIKIQEEKQAAAEPLEEARA